MELMLPCGFWPLCLYWTLKPKLFFVPGSPAMVPAEFCITKKPPPVIIPAPTCERVTTVLSVEAFRM